MARDDVDMVIMVGIIVKMVNSKFVDRWAMTEGGKDLSSFV